MSDAGETVDADSVLGDSGTAEAARGVHVVFSVDVDVVGRVVEVATALSVGRASGLTIDDDRMSRVHCTIRRRPDGGYRVEDEGSRNGTRVDGRPVAGHAALTDGAVIRVGDTVLVFDRIAADPGPVDPVLRGPSVALQEIRAQIERVGPSGLSVLVLGETGTGKELVARRLHETSGRRGPFVAVNCAAIPGELAESALFGHRKGAFTGATDDAPGYFRAAHGGTLFLDEVGELGLDLQPKLLRALELGEVTPVGTTQPATVDVRVVAATNVDLASEVECGTFRRDLYARLAHYVLVVPPLRKRPVDTMAIARSMLAELEGAQPPMRAGFVEAMLVHPWPMNVRELRAVMERVIVLRHGTDPLTRADFDRSAGASDEIESRPAAEPGSPPTDAPTEAELREQLAQHGGNVSAIARRYGKAPRQVYRWLERHGIDPTGYRRRRS